MLKKIKNKLLNQFPRNEVDDPKDGKEEEMNDINVQSPEEYEKYREKLHRVLSKANKIKLMMGTRSDNNFPTIKFPREGLIVDLYDSPWASRSSRSLSTGTFANIAGVNRTPSRITSFWVVSLSLCIMTADIGCLIILFCQAMNCYSFDFFFW